ncbi:uncharacterized protein N7496_012651 [Penicillium cataractarum]|uniref:Uncharacterized protein n=1 Tax=Penicillium cataractarum TaxID=2100454 RepID=A0A9W9RA14_9EURO|nr:uncharacterized protein N7496_012651 [Penicillium cataractarum]KAJ5355439.1 hypothetical protein N7496_012651 [Penicillium cataractarum]
MIVPKTLVILATALAATATTVHNQSGNPGWIQDNKGKDHYLNNGGSVTLSGGWGFFWIEDVSCQTQNSAAFSWPSGYGDTQIGTAHLDFGTCS